MKLPHAIDDVRRRLVWRLRARLVLAATLWCVIGTALIAGAFVTLVPTSSAVNVTRVFFASGGLALVALAIWLLRPTSARAVDWLEQQLPQLGGRLQTWRDTNARSSETLISGLLESGLERDLDALQLPSLIPQRMLIWPPVAAFGVLIVAVIVASGDSAYQLAAKRLWLGDALSQGAPRIVVAPGDVVVPRGADLVIDVTTSGFDAARVTMHARFEGAPGFEAAPMARTGPTSHSFVFVAVTDAIDYYVGSRSLNSDRFRIRVADLPRVTSVRASYTYPTWTHLEPDTRDAGGLAGVEGTEIVIEGTSTGPVQDPLLVVNGETQSAESTAAGVAGTITLEESGSWHFAVMHEGILTRISDEYPVALLRDAPPEVAFTWPGHDRPATSIEEVGLSFEATDDFGVESLALTYAINGGAWITAKLEQSGERVKVTGAHVFYLEDVRALLDGEFGDRALRPGDIVSFFAEARDHTSSTRSSLYFIDVRPFDRQYREAGQQGGNMQAGGGFEVAERQREILAATWNLINRRDTTGLDGADRDQVLTLAAMQRRLQTQVQTLIARAGARELGDADETGTFLAELTASIEDMDPAAEELEDIRLDEAIGPEQRALQHLLAAEATMREVDVAFGDYEGGRGTSGRALEELVEIELDPERNRYESPESPDFGAQDEAGQNDDWRELEALAARQQRLAERSAQNPDSQVSRWQQERLQRELESLLERVDRAEQRGTPGARSDAREQLDSALRSMERALTEGSARPARKAGDLLSETAEALRQAGSEALGDRVQQNQTQVRELLVSQSLTRDRLDELAREMREAAGRGEELPYYDFSMEAWGTTKRRMQSDLAEVTRDLEQVRAALADRNPAAAESLERALDDLMDGGVDGRLAYVAAAFELGRPLLAGTHEAEIERALERFDGQLATTAALVESATGSSEDPLSWLRSLRAELGGDPSGGAVADVARRLDQLVANMELLEGALDLDTALDRSQYVALGVGEVNTEVLQRLVADRIDLIEARLLRLDKVAIRAQVPRDQLRDSDSASEYFTRLSRDETPAQPPSQ